MEKDNKPKTSLYAQFAADIREKIETGQYRPGDRLPSIVKAAEDAGLSAGTVKQAYKLLTDQGYLSMVQGSGTVVRDRRAKSDAGDNVHLIPAGKQAKAEKEISALFQHMADLGFTFEEIRILIDLKLRQFINETSKLTIGVIDCNPEARRMMTDKISEFYDSDIFEYGLETILSFPDRIPDDLSLIFTTTTHEETLNEVLADRVKINALALSPTAETISAIAKLNADDKIALVALSHEFIGIMLRALNNYSDIKAKPTVIHFGAAFELKTGEKYHYDAIILPANFEQFSTKAEQQKIAEFEQGGGKVIRFEYQMDHGSAILAEKLIETTKRRLQLEAVA